MTSASINVTTVRRPHPAAMTNDTITRTEDGTVIVLDPATGLWASGLSADEAYAELRLIAGRQAA